MRRRALRLPALAIWLAALPACSPPPPAANVAPALADLLGGDAPPGFARAIEPRGFHFPADHGAHPGYRHEWWYLTGQLDAAGDARFGFELTFFRFALRPPGSEPAGPSAWHGDAVYAAHFAVTDVTGGRFHAAQRSARGAVGLAGVEQPPLRVWVEDWTLRLVDDRWLLYAREADVELELALDAVKPVVLQGEAGLSRKSQTPGNASYYYSIPRLAAHGRLRLGADVHAVDGLAWLDREWGTSALDKTQTGWDWFALQLDDGSDLMFYRLRSADGASHAASVGTWIDADGGSRPLAADAIRIETLAHWTSPRGGRYPARWRLALPALGLELSVEPLLADQELPTWPRYWEGAVDVAGTRDGRPLSGRGYVELTGYAE